MCFHEENRTKVCAPCSKKIAFRKNKPEKYLITEKVENLIKKFANENFNSSDE